MTLTLDGVEILSVGDYYTRRLRELNPRSVKVPEGILQGFTECDCGNWVRGSEAFITLNNGDYGELICAVCAGRQSYLSNDPTEGCMMPVLERTEHLWSKDSQEFPFVAECHRKGCFYNVAAETEEDGQVKLALHRCPLRTETKVGMMVPKALAIEAWEQLDEVVTTLMEGTLDADQVERFRARAKGMADIIALIMPDPMRGDTTAVSVEAKRRYEARRDGRAYQTPGLEIRQPPPPPKPFTETTTFRELPASSRSRPVTPPKPPKVLTDQQKAGIKNAMDSGMFTAEQLAPVYEVPTEVIRQIAAG